MVQGILLVIVFILIMLGIESDNRIDDRKEKEYLDDGYLWDSDFDFTDSDEDRKNYFNWNYETDTWFIIGCYVLLVIIAIGFLLMVLLL